MATGQGTNHTGGSRLPERRHNGPWRHLVSMEIGRLTAELNTAQAVLDDQPVHRRQARQLTHLSNARTFLDDARRDVDDKSGPLRWYNGSQVDAAFAALHQAIVESTYVLPDPDLHARLPQILACGDEELGSDDARVQAVRALHQPRRWPPHVRNGSHQPYSCRERALVAQLVRDCFSCRDEKYATSRAFRNRLVRLTFIATVVLVTVVVIAASGAWTLAPVDVRDPNGDLVVWTDGSASSGWAVFLAIAVMGALGGFLGGIRTVARTRGSRNPFSLPYYQMLLKLPVGALAAVVGILVLQVGFLPGVLPATTLATVLVWAVAFGVAQQGITALVDRRVQGLVGSGDGPEEETKESTTSTTTTAPPPVPETFARSPHRSTTGERTKTSTKRTIV